jgi:hypothetical protein
VAYPGPLPANAQYWKYGPTPDDHTYHWYAVPAQVSGSSITFAIMDGGLGDDDLLENGVIVDQGGVAIQALMPARPIPTLTEWGRFLLSIAVLALAVLLPHRRFQQA